MGNKNISIEILNTSTVCVSWLDPWVSLPVLCRKVLYQNLGLIFFYYTEEPLCCLISQIEHISARFLQFSLCWLPKGEKQHTIKNIFVFV